MIQALRRPEFRPRWLALGVALLLALAYTFLNLNSAWDPVTNLSAIRAGVVNEDMPVTAGSTKVQVGEDLTRTLLESKTFGWKTISRQEAEDGLKNGSLDFYLHIPADASKLVAGLPTAASPAQAQLTVYADPAFNYPMHEIADSVAANVREQLNGKIAATYLEALVVGLHTAIDGVGQAADGARQIADGAKSASDGSGKLADGLDQAKTGSDQLTDGLRQVDAGAAELAAGAVQVRDGNRKLAVGLKEASAGAREIAKGNGQVYEGSKALVDGYRQLADGSDQLTAGLGEAVGGVRQIKQGVRDSLSKPDPVLSEAGASIKESINNLLVKKPWLAFDADFRQVIRSLNVLNRRADELQKDSVAQLTSALTQLEGGLVAAQNGSRQIAAGARRGHKEGQALIAGTRQLRDGANRLAAGVDEAAAGAGALADGAGKLAAGAARLEDGTGQLYDGSRALSAGLGQLQDGGRQLKDGLGQLSTGTEQLATGLGSATKPALPPKANAAPMSQAVKVENGKITAVPKPGEALLAVVIPMALWIGALALVLACGMAGAAAGMWGTGENAWQRLRSMLAPGLALTGAVWLLCLVLGPRIAHPLWLLLFIGLTAFSFIALNQMLLGTLGRWGVAISAFLMILMPVTLGSRAPYILLPKLYQWTAPFLPMTHALRGVQATVGGGAWSMFLISVVALAVFIGLSLWLHHRFRRKEEPAVA